MLTSLEYGDVAGWRALRAEARALLGELARGGHVPRGLALRGDESQAELGRTITSAWLHLADDGTRQPAPQTPSAPG